MKKGIIYLLLMFFPLMGVGYTQKSESPALPIYEEWIDHEVEVCGVKDPVVNMDWIQEEMSKYDYHEALVVDLYHNFIMTDTVIVLKQVEKIMAVYTCSGEKLYDFEENPYEDSIMPSYAYLQRIYFYREIDDNYQLPMINVWINHEIDACGVQDPILNLDWMATTLATEKSRQSEFQVELRKCKETGDMVFVFPKKDADDNYIQFDVYNCVGEKIYSYEFIGAIVPDRVISKYDFIQVVYTYKITYHTTRYEPPTHVGLGCTNSSGCSNGSDMSRPQY